MRNFEHTYPYAYTFISIYLTVLAGGQAGREEVMGPRELRLLGPSETMQASYKKSIILAPFGLRWASGLSRALGEPGGAGGGGGQERIYMCIY